MKVSAPYRLVNMSTSNSSVPIALAIQSLRQELSQALKEGQGQELRFELGPVELEFQVEVSWDVGGKAAGKGGINFSIISLGEASAEVEAKRSQGKIHTIKLTLNPKTSDGSNVRVSASDATERPG